MDKGNHIEHYYNCCIILQIDLPHSASERYDHSLSVFTVGLNCGPLVMSFFRFDVLSTCSVKLMFIMYTIVGNQQTLQPLVAVCTFE